MSAVAFVDGEFSVDAVEIAKGLRIHPARLRAGMRHRRITSLCERGIEEDAGRYRLTFFYGQRQLRLIVDAAGTIICREVEDRRLLPGSGTRSVDMTSAGTNGDLER